MIEWDTDAFGHVMYEGVRARVMNQGRTLETIGFRQAHSKPWLFVRVTPHGPVFANLGGSGIVRIWKDSRPRLHHQLKAPRWQIRKTLKQIQWEFEANELSYRYSFYETDEPGGLWFPVEDEEPVDAEEQTGPDGYCHRCGAELLVGDLYCEACRDVLDVRARVACVACKDKFTLETTVVHHTSYDPETTVRVCRSCHLRIHRSNAFPDLKPSVLSREK